MGVTQYSLCETIFFQVRKKQLKNKYLCITVIGLSCLFTLHYFFLFRPTIGICNNVSYNHYLRTTLEKKSLQKIDMKYKIKLNPVKDQSMLSYMAYLCIVTRSWFPLRLYSIDRDIISIEARSKSQPLRLCTTFMPATVIVIHIEQSAVSGVISFCSPSFLNCV